MRYSTLHAGARAHNMLSAACHVRPLLRICAPTLTATEAHTTRAHTRGEHSCSVQTCSSALSYIAICTDTRFARARAQDHRDSEDGAKRGMLVLHQPFPGQGEERVSITTVEIAAAYRRHALKITALTSQTARSQA